MSDETRVADLEARITAALDRIGVAVEAVTAMPAPEPAPAADDAALTAAEARIAELETALAERDASNTALEERVAELKRRQDGHIRRLEGKVAGFRDANAALDGEVQRLMSTNAELTRMLGELGEAGSAEAVEPHLINRAMKAELEALRVARSVESHEVAAVLTDLRAALEPEADVEEEA